MSETILPKGAIAIDRGPHDAVIILDGTYAATVPKRLADAIEALQKTQQPGMWIQAHCYVGAGHYFNAYVRSGEPTPMYCNEHLKATEQPEDSAPAYDTEYLRDMRERLEKSGLQITNPRACINCSNVPPHCECGQYTPWYQTEANALHALLHLAHLRSAEQAQDDAPKQPKQATVNKMPWNEV